jgi:antitoxin PrlF
MSQATMTSKGQITVPRDVREDLGLVAGSKVMFVKLGPRHYRIVARTGEIDELFGILHQPGVPALTLEEIEEGISAGAVETGLRGLEDRA